MADEQEKKIRARAHAIWLEEGSPSGRDQDHWEQAEREIAAKTETPKAKPGRKPKPAATAAEGSDKLDGASSPAPKKSTASKTPPKATTETKQPKRAAKATPKQA